MVMQAEDCRQHTEGCRQGRVGIGHGDAGRGLQAAHRGLQARAVGRVVQDVSLPVASLMAAQQLQGLLIRSGRASPALRRYVGPFLSWQDEGSLLDWQERRQLVGCGDAPLLLMACCHL